MTHYDDCVDAALYVTGGESNEFYLKAELANVDRGVAARLSLECRYGNCTWKQHIGEIELWEVVADALFHWEDKHAFGS